MKPGRLRAAWWAGALLVGAGLGVAAWWWLAGPVPQPPLGTESGATPVAPWPAEAVSAPEPASAALAMRQAWQSWGPAKGTAPDPVRPALAPWCGLGWRPGEGASSNGASPSTAADTAASLPSLKDWSAQVGQRARLQVLRQLRHSADEADRATAWWLGNSPYVSPLAGAPVGAGGAALSGQAELSLRQLASLAATTSSGYVYGIALHACQGASLGQPEPACAALTEERWSALDPGNAAPWLALAQRAIQQGDAAGVDNAMLQAARASRLSLGQTELMRRVQARMPPDWQGRAALEVSQAALTAAFSLPMNGLIGVMGHCRAEAVQDANRQQVCAALAQRLLALADNLTDLGVAVSLAERVGLPAAQVAAARERRDAAYWVSAQLFSEPDAAAWAGPADCQRVQAAQQHLARLARQGELAALAVWIGQLQAGAVPGDGAAALSPAQMAQLWRQGPGRAN